MRRRIKSFVAAGLAAVLSFSCFFGQPMTARAEENLIINGNFEDPDNLEVWSPHQNGATITAEVSETPVVGDITTYGKITNRTSNYACFAQDVTGRVEQRKTYYYTFYVMLDAEDYKDAPKEQRSVEISPHILANGKSTYSECVSGTVQQYLEPGVWTKFTGMFRPSWNGELEKIELRFLEQGTNYGQGPGVMGTYYVTGIVLSTEKPQEEQVEVQPKLIQNDIVNLKDAVNEKLGMNGEYTVGAAITHNEVTDAELMGLVKKHFNAVTLGNELKPDALFGYRGSNPFTETVTFNGEELLVPLMDYSRAEQALNVIYNWNKKNPENVIKVRGHVLLWHSQTPNWFFYEDYDTSKALASPELMAKRLEWYIATVAEHFTGESSKYKDMFYAWDVVNEAVSDNSGTYRNDKENSMWWKVYQSNEFIIQAFRFANKYMPESVDLYYNDYNEWYSNKVRGICQLLNDVKNAEGTRIDGMGMQGHYATAGGLTTIQFKDAARAYAKIVDKIQITEWDLSVSSECDGTTESVEKEYRRQATRYFTFYKAIQELREEGIDFSGMTFWGVIDPNSWLQTRNSVGGASDGTKKQYPLLFDGEYQAKPAFWAFADIKEYAKLVNVTPTPKPTATPKPTKEPEPTAEPEVSVVPTEAPDVAEPAVDNGASGSLVPILGIAAILIMMAAAIVVLLKKKSK